VSDSEATIKGINELWKALEAAGFTPCNDGWLGASKKALSMLTVTNDLLNEERDRNFRLQSALGHRPPSGTGKFNFSPEWCINAAAKEKIGELEAEIAALKEESKRQYWALREGDNIVRHIRTLIFPGWTNQSDHDVNQCLRAYEAKHGITANYCTPKP
jgi:hypothetical protein